MGRNMPKKRPSDNVKLNIDFPQEDELALSNSQPNAYYNFFYFPINYKTYYNKAVALKDVSQKEIYSFAKRLADIRLRQ